MNDGPLPDKRAIARSLLLRGSMFIHLDPRVEGVVVPPWFRDKPQLVLQVGLDMPVPIPDLRIDADGVSATLSFNRSPFLCFVAWDAIYALSGEDGQGMVWPESMPPEIAAEVEREAGRRRPAGLTEGQPRAALALAPDADAEGDEAPEGASGRGEYEPPARPSRGGNVVSLHPAPRAPVTAVPPPEPAEPAEPIRSSEPSDSPDDATSEPPAPPAEIRRGHLRLIK